MAILMAQAGAAILDLGEQYVLLKSPIQVACIDGELRILLLELTQFHAQRLIADRKEFAHFVIFFYRVVVLQPLV